MFTLPHLPSFDGLHPLVVHFPIALFIITPLLVLIAMVAWKHRLAWLAAAVLLMVAGATAAFVAVESGEDAAELADRSQAINKVLEQHEYLAELTRNTFAALAVLLVAWLALAFTWADRIKRRAWILVLAGYVLAHGAALLLLVNTAHQGGRLVHELGIRAML